LDSNCLTGVKQISKVERSILMCQSGTFLK
jgi:hypothetical protein